MAVTPLKAQSGFLWLDPLLPVTFAAIYLLGVAGRSFHERFEALLFFRDDSSLGRSASIYMSSW